MIRKIVGTLKNPKGAEMFARLLSVLGTWKLRKEGFSGPKLRTVLS